MSIQSFSKDWSRNTTTTTIWMIPVMIPTFGYVGIKRKGLSKKRKSLENDRETIPHEGKESGSAGRISAHSLLCQMPRSLSVYDNPLSIATEMHMERRTLVNTNVFTNLSFESRLESDWQRKGSPRSESSKKRHLKAFTGFKCRRP